MYSLTHGLTAAVLAYTLGLPELLPFAVLGSVIIGQDVLISRPGRLFPCVLLEGGRCRHYAARPSICRVYPYMLHREPGADGRIDWPQLAGLGEHGQYGEAISAEEAGRCADETIAYEVAFLEQTLGFYRTAAAHFANHGLRHVQKVRDDRLRAHARGEPLEVLVFHRGRFEPCRLQPPRA